MDAGFHVKLEHDDLAWTIVCGGELDVASATRLEEAVDLCAQLRPESLRIDGRDLTFIDTAGMSALLRFAHLCQDEGIEFGVEVSEQVRTAIAGAGLERLLLRHVPVKIA